MLLALLASLWLSFVSLHKVMSATWKPSTVSTLTTLRRWADSSNWVNGHIPNISDNVIFPFRSGTIPTNKFI